MVGVSDVVCPGVTLHRVTSRLILTGGVWVLKLVGYWGCSVWCCCTPSGVCFRVRVRGLAVRVVVGSGVVVGFLVGFLVMR